jgi:polar amino acid transport system substrate-binding protein
MRTSLRVSLLLGYMLSPHFAQADVTHYRVLAGDIPPFSFTQDGKASGIAVDMLHAVESELNVHFDFDVCSWPRAQRLAQQGGGYLIVPLTRTPAREPNYHWIAPLYEYQYVFVTSKRPAPASIEEARTLDSEAFGSGAIVPALKGLHLNNVGLSESEEINAKRLHLGLTQAWLVADILAPYVYRRAGYDPAELHQSPFGVGERSVVELGASPDFPEADAAKIRTTLGHLRQSGKLAEILLRYR